MDARAEGLQLVTAVRPSLPAGGGAIRGIGQSFAMNAANGTCSLSVPIAVTPARSLTPQLALTYDSGAGNGPFGAGWRMSVASIARRCDRGVPTYDDDADTFVLAGGEDLVPVGGGRYQPRIEAAFARIERQVDGWWIETSAANVRSVYGETAAARIADPDAPDRVYAWLLERMEDAVGNVVVFEYVAEDLANVAESTGERHRLDGTARFANRYLKRIRYGNTVAGDPASCVLDIVFDYGDHADEALEPTGAWPARADAFSTYRCGFEVRTYRLCQRVLMFHTMPELGDTPCLVRSVALGYDGNPALAKLTAVEQRGHIRDGASYRTAATPALVLGYTTAQPDGQVRELALDGDGDLPAGIDGARHQWVDLDAEGIPGVLSDADDALYFRRNLGNGALGPPRALVVQPSGAALASGGQQLMDVGGDGRLDLVAFGGELPGFYERVPTADGEGSWDAFQPFAAQPQIAWSDPRVRFLDLDGDGIEDVLVSGDDTWTWYPSLGKAGFGPPRTVPCPRDEDAGPVVLFADATRSIALADLSGDGLRDLVRIENGRICYWPNLGHGRFGAMVTMASPPVFDAPDQFEARRVMFADIDGTGTSDVMYAGRDGVRYWCNQAGNGWSAAHEVAMPAETTAASITVADVLGSGTACLVWSSPLASQHGVRYLDLAGGVKPHLLADIDNQVGGQTRIGYAPSTKFYLADRAAGVHWKTTLGFPVHVIERVETYDTVQRVRLVSEYRYRDGYFDGYERELRGFGYVEQRDTGSASAAIGLGLFGDLPPPRNGERAQPPVVTRRWFHTGAWLDDGPSGRIVVPAGLTTDESRDAYRALRGRVLREEIYAEDGSAVADRPYVVRESGYEVRPIAAGVFAAFPRESIERYHERGDDPRVLHTVNLDTDTFGHLRRSVSIGYPRTAAEARAEQRELIATLGEIDVANEDGAYFRHGVPLESRSFELRGLPLPAAGDLLGVEQVRTVANAALAIATDAVPPPGASKRLIQRSRTRYYDSAALPAALPFGAIDALALVYEQYALAFTPSIVATLYGMRVTDAMLVEAGYRQLDDTSWWAASGRSLPDPARFYQPVSFTDPFGNPPTTVAYDPYTLMAIAMTDPRGGNVHVDPDYRLMVPVTLTDVDGNQEHVTFDELGRVTAVWRMGNPARDEGDRPPAAPTATFTYAFHDPATGRPSRVEIAMRLTHGDPATAWRRSYTYFDGAGREAMKKVPAEPGKALELANNACIEVDADPRWVGNGRTVLDNKGNSIKQYEPYFSTTPDYEDEDELVCQGVTSLLHYDPVGRLIRTELPDGSVSRVDITPWRQASWDPNDTLADLGNAWLARAQASPDPALQRAAALALEHAGTPTVTHFDPLGRACAVVADNKTAQLETRTTFDVQSRPVITTDALGRACRTGAYNLIGEVCREVTIDAGEHRFLPDVSGALIRRWDRIDDTHDRVVHIVLDVMRRPVEVRVQLGNGPELLVERTVWGEDAPATAQNVRGRIYQTFDGAGVLTTEGYDFKGNPLARTRQLAADYTQTPDWLQSPALDPELFHTSTEYDALDRPIRAVAPDGSVLRSQYNVASLLEGVTVQDQPIVAGIAYDAQARRTEVRYGNVATTTYSYDPLSSRMTGLHSVRPAGVLLDLAYSYDPVGNVSQIRDAQQAPVYFAGSVVDGTARYWYEPIYRLARADGREHASIGPRGDADMPELPLPSELDEAALVPYSERYSYDAVGNVLATAHDGAASWTSPMHYAAGTNRLAATMVDGDDPAAPDTWHGTYGYDAFGNTTAMPHLPQIAWNWKDQMQRADKGGGGTVYFTYDGTGARARKVWEHGGTIDERIYLGSFELYRRRKSGTVVLERQTLHVMDGARRVALIETKTIDADIAALVPAPVIRFQLDNHLESVAIELDAAGQLISYEEYHPFGTTAYRAFGSVEVSARRYRYCGKERDEETALYYFGRRYYAPWLARWASPDPAGIGDGVAVYAYVSDNPITVIDPDGAEGRKITGVTEVRIVNKQTGRLELVSREEIHIEVPVDPPAKPPDPVQLQYPIFLSPIPMPDWEPPMEDTGRWVENDARGFNPFADEYIWMSTPDADAYEGKAAERHAQMWDIAATNKSIEEGQKHFNDLANVATGTDEGAGDMAEHDGDSTPLGTRPQIKLNLPTPDAPETPSIDTLQGRIKISLDLADRAEDLHAPLTGPAARERVTAVQLYRDTDTGKLVTVYGATNRLSNGQLKLELPGERASQGHVPDAGEILIVPNLNHGEMITFRAAPASKDLDLGNLDPIAIGIFGGPGEFCCRCCAAIDGSGAVRTGPRTAVWPPGATNAQNFDAFVRSLFGQ